VDVPYRQIRADFDRDTIVVYQAYNDAIADAAIQAQRFVAPFSFQRATWIKPSFLWMMERAGWGRKPNQERILGVRLSRVGWEEALSEAVLTHPSTSVYSDTEAWEQRMKKCPVLVQWDPERSLRGGKLEHRSIQVGLRRQVVERFAKEWVVAIEDLTPLAKKIAGHKARGEYSKASRQLPPEREYPVPSDIARNIGL
jgi:hypothetical protein